LTKQLKETGLAGMVHEQSVYFCTHLCTHLLSISAHTYAHIYMFGFSTNANMPSCSDCYFIWFKSENFAI